LNPANFIPDLSVIDDHIDPTDAQQVDIIHTDQFSGILQPLGTIDFFVNGGAHQTGCPDIAAGEEDPGKYKFLILNFIMHVCMNS